MTPFDSKMSDFLQFYQTVQKAVDRYSDAYETAELEGWHSFNVEALADGSVVVVVYWEDDFHCGCCPPDSGCVEIPLEDLRPYIENQWELDKFDRKLEKESTHDV